MVYQQRYLYARGGRVDQLTKIVIDDPLSYSDMQLIHSTSSPGFGSEARADIVVSQGSTVMDFKITNTGYGYGVGEILTLSLTGSKISAHQVLLTLKSLKLLLMIYQVTILVVGLLDNTNY